MSHYRHNSRSAQLTLIAVTMLATLAATVRADGPFSISPYWESGAPNRTRSLALGDIDIDGDLDLVFGNATEPKTLFVNDGGRFGDLPAWSADPTRSTRGIALGDVDGDGDLDLVCGNYLQGNTLYLNADGRLSQTPAWVDSTSERVSCVALGDINNDLLLDLVVAIQNDSNAVYLNNGGTFPTTPSYRVGGENPTRSIALGDINGDALLDLVCGNSLIGFDYQNNHAYLNVGGTLAAAPAWSSDSTFNTTAVALGDIDGDGRLDLVCGNYNHPNTAYLNGGTMLETAPAWLSTPTNNTLSVDIGDADNDGDLDLVCGNEYQANTAYLNAGGTLSTDPAWSSGSSNRTWTISLADIDGDGDLDLVCGNSDGANTAYVNVTGPFESWPSWETDLPSENKTKSVALADVDNDGDLDLACGNFERPNTFYPNESGVLARTPLWSSSEVRFTASIALGRVDGDDRVDLVCGNEADQENTVYRNDGTSFAVNPTWLSQRVDETTKSVALGDVDGDRRLDLVCGNAGDSNTVYLNLGSSLDTIPDWRSNLGLRTSGIALGDINGDDRIDLVCGNNAEANTLYLNQGMRLAPEPAWYSALELSTNDVGLGDVDGDGDLDMVCANFAQANTVYLNEGGMLDQTAAWSSAAPERATQSLALGDVDGDGDLDMVCANAAEPNTAYINEGGVFSRAPGWLSGLARDTEDVALGDVDADGDLDVVFGNENAANTLYRGNKNPPYQGDPSNPNAHRANNGPYLRRVSVDPIGPNTHRVRFSLVDVESDPVWVLVEYQFRGDPAWFPADVNGRSGSVGTFPTSPTAIADSLDWNTASVPSDGRDITLRLTPIEIPRRVSFVQHSASYVVDIGRIPLIDTFSKPATGSEFFETRDIVVELRLPPGASSDQARLYFRRGGEETYQEVAFEEGTPLPFATIPSEWVGARGIEYWVEAQTPVGTLSDPRENPTQRPRSIRITTTNLREEHEHEARRYRMMTIPLDLESALSIIRALQDDIGFPDETRWRLFAHDTAGPRYLELPNDTILSFEHGRGYWLVTNASHRLDTAPVFGKSTPTDSAFALLLKPGWNLVGHPFAFPVAWNNVQQATGATALGAPIAWADDHYEYDVGALSPWQAYWIENRSSETTLLRIPPVEATPGTFRSPSRAAPDGGWVASVTASSSGAVDSYNRFGVRRDAGDEWDVRDRSEAPMGPGRSISLYFPHPNWSENAGDYTVDIRGSYDALDDAAVPAVSIAPGQWGQIWRFDVAKNFADVAAGDEVTLRFSGVEDIPEGAIAFLVDRRLEHVVDLRRDDRYVFFQGNRGVVAGEDDARFVILVGSEEFALWYENELPEDPTRTALRQNYPNPFNPVTIVRFDVAAVARVTIRIYDARGARVRDLYSGERQPGVYELSWDGTDDDGRSVASGIYFCRLAAGNTIDTKKMLLLK